jgi:hypothetical protein
LGLERLTKDKRLILWNHITSLAHNINLPWILLGDFNEIWTTNEKLGGRPINSFRVQNFKSFMDCSGLRDMALVDLNLLGLIAILIGLLISKKG